MKPGDVQRMGPRDDGGPVEEEASDDSDDGSDQARSWTAPKRLVTGLRPSLRRVDGVGNLRGKEASSLKSGNLV